MSLNDTTSYSEKEIGYPPSTNVLPEHPVSKKAPHIPEGTNVGFDGVGGVADGVVETPV